MAIGVGVYLLGIVIGLWRVDGSIATRLLVAVLWPLGVASFLVTVGGLLAATLVLFPLVGVVALVAGALSWWLLAS